MRRIPFLILAAISATGCGNVKPMDTPDAAPDAPNPCAPNPCLLQDDFSGASLNPSLWGMNVAGGATVSQASGALRIALPAVADASADVYSLVGFPVGTTLEARVTFSAGQFYDHKAVGFSAGPVGNQCDVGETDAAIFRGQDGDGYIETKAANAPTCVNATPMYAAGTSKLQITRTMDQVVFHQNDVMIGTMTTTLPAGLLPVRFSAYTYTLAPNAPVEIDVDYVFVKRP